ncbi:MAG: nucleotidyltransferase domain-containing protein [Gammaproteobacteria bacterium]|jgi:predicted nucleotidyltransferase
MDIKNYKFYKDLINLAFIKEIWIFGSRARGDNQDRADLDLAVLCDNANFEDWLKIRSIIDNADTLLKIDCIRLDELAETSSLKIAIMQQGIKLYERS